MKEIVAIVLNWNKAKLTIQSINNILNYEGEVSDIIVVDNGSTSKEKEILIDYAKFHQFMILKEEVIEEVININFMDALASNEHRKYMILLNRNKGYAAGNNSGLKLANIMGYKYALIVNNDVIFEQPILQYLKNIMQKYSNIAVAGPEILSASHVSQGPFAKPGLLESILRPLFYPFTLILLKTTAKKKELQKNHSEVSIVYRVMGCCMLMKMDAVKKAGYFDEHTFLYAEEAILSERLMEIGYKVGFVPGVYVRHLHAETTKSQSRIRTFFMQLKSDIYYFQAYRKSRTLFILFFVVAQSAMFFIWAPLLKKLKAIYH
jgi:hypothetical protein